MNCALRGERQREAQQRAQRAHGGHPGQALRGQPLQRGLTGAPELGACAGGVQQQPLRHARAQEACCLGGSEPAYLHKQQNGEHLQPADRGSRPSDWACTHTCKGDGRPYGLLLPTLLLGNRQRREAGALMTATPGKTPPVSAWGCQTPQACRTP